jgi:hypothetical protein
MPAVSSRFEDPTRQNELHRVEASGCLSSLARQDAGLLLRDHALIASAEAPVPSALPPTVVVSSGSRSQVS